LRNKLKTFCDRAGKSFIVPPAKYCSDNGAMVAFVGGYKYEQKKFVDFSLDIFQ